MMEKYEIFNKYELTEDQINNIDKYLQASHLLLQCLDKAAVTDREALKTACLCRLKKW